MKKLFTIFLLYASISFASTGWYNDFLTINSGTPTVFYIGANPGSGTQLDGSNLGTVLSLSITAADMKYWSDTQDRLGGAFYYKIMSSDGLTEIIASTETIWTQTYLGGNDYDGNWTGTIDLLSGLSAGTTYQLHVWAKSWGSGQGDSFLSNSGLNYVATFTVDNSFPIELLSFYASKLKSGIALNWSTATEVNNYGFEIERQILKQVQNDSNGWEKIGFVQGHGNSNSPKDYSFIDQEKVAERSRSYRLKQLDFDGSFHYSDVVSVNNALAKSFKLFAPYPNPFNPNTTIKFSIPAASNVSLKIYDIIGNEIANLVNGRKDAGEYEVDFNAKNLPSGIYFSTLRSNGNTQTQKLILMK